MMRKIYQKVLMYCLLSGILISTTSCALNDLPSSKTVQPQKQEFSFPVTIKNYDTQGRETETTYQKPPQRIIALWQNSVETLIELGAGNQIVSASGIDDPKHLTESNRKIYETLPVTSKQVINQEQAVALRPDFILGWLFDFTGKANSIGTTNFWKEHHVPVYLTMMNMTEFLPIHTVEDELQYILDVGRITGHAQRAEEINGSIKANLSRWESYAQHHSKKEKVLFIESMKQDISLYTPRTLPGNIASRMGANVIGKDGEQIGKAETISYERLIMEDPDIIFIQSTPELDDVKQNSIYNDPRFQNLTCVKNRRVYPIPFYTIRDPAVRVRDAIMIIGHGLYPNADF